MKYGLIAEKVGHSYSAEIHNKLFGYEYELKALSPNELESFMHNKEFSAVNVTIPYKEAVIPYLDYVNETALFIGSVNTVVNKAGKLCGYNTDVMGLTALINKINIDITGKKVLVLGSGGTSKTAEYTAKALGCSSVYRCSRSKKEGCISYDEAINDHSDAEVIINTTPSGMYPHIGESAIDINCFQNLVGVVDAVYNPLRPKLVCDALAKGIKAEGGLYMLVAQAAFAGELFANEKASPEKIQSVYDELYRSKENIVLIGMPGCGKTATGRHLAQKFNRRLIDTDVIILEKTGKAPADIIKEQGETAFRDIESNVIKEISLLSGVVISTGGGAVLRRENVNLLRENGKIYFIDRPVEDIKTSENRPLTSNREDLERRYKERYEIYCASCDKRIIPLDGANLNADLILEDFLK